MCRPDVTASSALRWLHGSSGQPTRSPVQSCRAEALLLEAQAYEACVATSRDGSHLREPAWLEQLHVAAQLRARSHGAASVTDRHLHEAAWVNPAASAASALTPSAIHPSHPAVEHRAVSGNARFARAARPGHIYHIYPLERRAPARAWRRPATPARTRLQLILEAICAGGAV